MNLAAKVVAAFLQEKELKYTLLGENEDVIRVGFRAENLDTIEVKLFFDEDSTTVGLRSFDLCKIPENKKQNMYKACSDLNARFRWAKFYVDERDSTICVATDAVIQIDSCGEECYELIFRMVGIIDEAYPDMMKALWG